MDPFQTYLQLCRWCRGIARMPSGLESRVHKLLACLCGAISQILAIRSLSKILKNLRGSSGRSGPIAEQTLRISPTYEQPVRSLGLSWCTPSGFLSPRAVILEVSTQKHIWANPPTHKVLLANHLNVDVLELVTNHGLQLGLR